MGILGGLGKLVKGAATVGSFIPGPHQGIAQGISAGLGLLGGAKDKAKGSKIQDQLSQRALARDKQLQPVRDKAIGLALGPKPQRRALGRIFGDAGNPYNRAGPSISDLGPPQFAPQIQPPAGQAPAPRPFMSPVQGPLLGRLQRGGLY